MEIDLNSTSKDGPVFVDFKAGWVRHYNVACTNGAQENIPATSPEEAIKAYVATTPCHITRFIHCWENVYCIEIDDAESILVTVDVSDNNDESGEEIIEIPNTPKEGIE